MGAKKSTGRGNSDEFTFTQCQPLPMDPRGSQIFINPPQSQQPKKRGCCGGRGGRQQNNQACPPYPAMQGPCCCGPPPRPMPMQHISIPVPPPRICTTYKVQRTTNLC
jgi:hypothetical protein